MTDQPTLRALLEGFLALTDTQKEPLDKTADVILELISSRLKEHQQPTGFEDLNWLGEEAYIQGYKAGIKKVLALLEGKE